MALLLGFSEFFLSYYVYRLIQILLHMKMIHGRWKKSLCPITCHCLYPFTTPHAYRMIKFVQRSLAPPIVIPNYLTPVHINNIGNILVPLLPCNLVYTHMTGCLHLLNLLP